MREFNALKSYPKLDKRVVGDRMIKHRIIACNRGFDFFDGDRNYGYGGYHYNGWWLPVAKDLVEEYGLTGESSVLQLQCEKGFLLHDLLSLHPMKVKGSETSVYARHTAMKNVKNSIILSPPIHIQADKHEFDLVIALGVVYSLMLSDAMDCLREITRVGKQSFITLASYDTEEDLRLFRQWTLLSSLVLKKDEWREVLNHCGFTGDYQFINAQTLRLMEQSHGGN